MAFCSHCGAELVPGNRFCVHCGKPVDDTPQGTGGPAPVTSHPPGMTGKGVIILVVVAAAAIIAAAILISLPLIKTGIPFSDAAAHQSSGYTRSYTVTNVTATLPAATTVPVTTVPTRNIQRSDRSGAEYEEVYALARNFSYGQKEEFTRDVKVPPLYIRFSLEPLMVERHTMVSIGTSMEHLANTTEASPNAWFEVNVYDASTGKLVDQQGFGKDYTDDINQEFMVRQPGSYRVELSGHQVFANVSAWTGIE